MPTVKMTLDPDRPPKISRQDRARIDGIRDEAIDYSDIPELDDDFFAKARKESVTARFDADMVAWFKAQGKGYQTRMNAVLRALCVQLHLIVAKVLRPIRILLLPT